VPEIREEFSFMRDVRGDVLSPKTNNHVSLEAPEAKGVKTQFGEILLPKYSFEHFVVGKSNQFAHASSLAITEKHCVYNPLFITGKTGLGKTHLLKAVGYKLGSPPYNLKIGYISAQKFIEAVIQAIRHDTRHKLHDRFLNNCDVLLVDDIQFLSKATSTQDEFFHIFNNLFDASKQIVITSDRPPKEIKDVSDRLISRFEWGMVADIEPPELETRVAILKAKADADGINLSDESAYLIGSYVKANIRELEGSLTKIAGHAAIYNVPISTDLVKKVLKNYISDKQKILQIEEIIAAVAQYYSVKVADLKGPSRKENFARARQIVMYLARKHTHLSTNAIGQDLGNRHHTTIIHGENFISKNLKTDFNLKSQITELENKLLDH